MLLLIRPLGMRVRIGATSPPTSLSGTTTVTPTGATPAPSFGPPAEPKKSKVTLAVPKVYLAAVAVVVAALVIGISNVGLGTYNLVAGVTGEAKLTAFIQGPVAPHGWSAQYETTYGWAKPLFGDTSIWNRYALHSEGSNPLRTDVPVVADVINTPDLSSFSAFGVENCYAFHGYALADVTQVALAGGITGQAMSYTSQQFGSWSIVYWIVPVKMDTGTTSYERVVLYVQNSGQGVVVRGPTTAEFPSQCQRHTEPFERNGPRAHQQSDFPRRLCQPPDLRPVIPRRNRRRRFERDLGLTDGSVCSVRCAMKVRFTGPDQPWPHVRGGSMTTPIGPLPCVVGSVRRPARRPGELKIKERRSWKTWQLLTAVLIAAIFGMWINGDTGGGAASTTGTSSGSGKLPPPSASPSGSAAGGSTATTTTAAARAGRSPRPLPRADRRRPPRGRIHDDHRGRIHDDVDPVADGRNWTSASPPHLATAPGQLDQRVVHDDSCAMEHRLGIQMRPCPRHGSLVPGVRDPGRVASLWNTCRQRDRAVGAVGHGAVQPRGTDARGASSGGMYLDRQSDRLIASGVGRGRRETPPPEGPVTRMRSRPTGALEAISGDTGTH